MSSNVAPDVKSYRSIESLLQSRERARFADYPHEVIITRDKMQGEFKKWCENQETSSVLKTGYGYNIIKLRFKQEESKTMFLLQWGDIVL